MFLRYQKCKKSYFYIRRAIIELLSDFQSVKIDRTCENKSIAFKNPDGLSGVLFQTIILSPTLHYEKCAISPYI